PDQGADDAAPLPWEQEPHDQTENGRDNKLRPRMHDAQNLRHAVPDLLLGNGHAQPPYASRSATKRAASRSVAALSPNSFSAACASSTTASSRWRAPSTPRIVMKVAFPASASFCVFLPTFSGSPSRSSRSSAT